MWYIYCRMSAECVHTGWVQYCQACRKKFRDVGHSKTPPRSEVTIWPVVDRLVTPHNYGRLIETEQHHQYLPIFLSFFIRRRKSSLNEEGRCDSFFFTSAARNCRLFFWVTGLLLKLARLDLIDFLNRTKKINLHSRLPLLLSFAPSLVS